MPPTYGMYKVLANINCISLDEVPLSNDFQLVTKDIFNQISSHTKAIFLCSPNNPSGNSFHRADILSLLKSFDGLVVVDEAYIDFFYAKSLVTDLPYCQSYHYPNPFQGLWAGREFGLVSVFPVKRDYQYSQQNQTPI